MIIILGHTEQKKNLAAASSLDSRTDSDSHTVLADEGTDLAGAGSSHLPGVDETGQNPRGVQHEVTVGANISSSTRNRTRINAKTKAMLMKEKIKTQTARINQLEIEVNAHLSHLDRLEGDLNYQARRVIDRTMRVAKLEELLRQEMETTQALIQVLSNLTRPSII